MSNYSGWKDLQTRQSREILSELIEASEEPKALLLVSNSGLGKTNTINLFMAKKPKHAYRITVGKSFKLIDVVNELMDEMSIEYGQLKQELINKRLKLISNYIKDIHGCVPMIIIDEAENLDPSVLKIIKELYDAIHDYASIVLVGTDQILEKMLNKKGRNRDGVPQLWRRFKAGTRYISSLAKEKDFKPFFDLYIPGNTSLQALLLRWCENYGELNNFLDPVLKKASRAGKQPTDELFRLVHKKAN